MTSTQPANPTLHILNKPPGHPRFETCLQAIQDCDQLVLTENGTCPGRSLRYPSCRLRNEKRTSTPGR